MNVLLYLWQLPQNVLGLLITKILKVYWEKRYGFFFAYLSKPTRAWSGVSLGNYIIFSEHNKVIFTFSLKSFLTAVLLSILVTTTNLRKIREIIPYFLL